MDKNFDIKLKQITLQELPQFIIKLQESFSIAVKEKFGTTQPIPTENDIVSSFNTKGTAAYHIISNGKYAGGVMLTINEKTHRNSLDFFFISSKHHSHGIGYAAWKAIEEKYPDTIVWETITPYFEQRNIHFYVNKCRFHIVEFFNEHHTDPDISHPVNQTGEYIPGTETYFRFEKVMK